METLYKVLAADGCSPYHGGTGKWFVPKGKKPAKWMPKIDDLKLCYRGYHVASVDQLLTWIGPTLYEVEVRGKVLTADDKRVVEQARLIRRIKTWDDKTLRLFAADCAEHVLELYENQCPAVDRPRNAIKAAREFAEGKITRDELNAAHDAAACAARQAPSDAASHAAHAAAYAVACAAAASAAAVYATRVACAAYATACAAYATRVACAAYATAYAASDATAYAAAHASAGRAAEKKWQLGRLKYYMGIE